MRTVGVTLIHGLAQPDGSPIGNFELVDHIARKG